MLKWPHYKSNLDDIKIEPGTRRLWSQHEASDSEWEDHKYPGVQSPMTPILRRKLEYDETVNDSNV